VLFLSGEAGAVLQILGEPGLPGLIILVPAKAMVLAKLHRYVIDHPGVVFLSANELHRVKTTTVVVTGAVEMIDICDKRRGVATVGEHLRQKEIGVLQRLPAPGRKEVSSGPPGVTAGLCGEVLSMNLLEERALRGKSVQARC
jgi:hypothetical protein